MIVDKLVPYWSWFLYGFGVINITIGAANFGMLTITLLAVKGINVPIYAAIPVVMGLLTLCIFTGRFMEKHTIWAKLNSHINQKNPELQKLQEDVTTIKSLLEKLHKCN